MVLGGVAGGALAVWSTGARPPAAWWAILAAAIWVVYTADHLLDAARIGPGATSPRYRFHLRHARSLEAALVLVAAACGVAALVALPRAVFVGGLVLVAFSTVHLVVAQSRARRWVPKELSVAAVYTAGIWLAPLVLATRRSAWIAWIAGLHFLGVLLNLGMYAILEEPIDREEDSASVSRTIGAPAVRRIVSALTIAGAAAAAIGFWASPERYAAAWAPLLLVVG
ncbi:MAG: hypothetical protein ACM3JJ_07320, partial [Hyphomicrobiales bacterium]